MPEEISLKEFQKLKEQLGKLDNKINDQIKRIEQKAKDQFIQLDQKIEDRGNSTNKKIDDLANMFESELKEKFTTLLSNLKENVKTLNLEIEDKFKRVDRKLDEQVENLENQINSLLEKIKTLNEDFFTKLYNFKVEFDTKEEVLRDMIRKYHEENTEYKNDLEPILETLKSEQDLVKITVDVLKKQIKESAKEWIDNEIKLACKNKEKEILMNLWIDELKEIINNLDKLKEIHPKELKLHINEISHTIESFKQKFIK